MLWHKSAHRDSHQAPVAVPLNCAPGMQMFKTLLEFCGKLLVWFGGWCISDAQADSNAEGFCRWTLLAGWKCFNFFFNRSLGSDSEAIRGEILSFWFKNGLNFIFPNWKILIYNKYSGWGGKGHHGQINVGDAKLMDVVYCHSPVVGGRHRVAKV